MDDTLQKAVVAAYLGLPDDCRYPPASEEQLRDFEQAFGAIPQEYRWFLSSCGGGVCGEKWVDGIAALPRTHQKFREESQPGGWMMRGVFPIGWDAAGNPFGIELSSGRVLVEDHDFGGVHEMAVSFTAFLRKGLGI